MRILQIIAFVLIAFTLEAQSNIYLQDLASMKAVIEKTSSFKSQIKGKELQKYEALYEVLMADTLSVTNDYRYFYNLAQLVFPLRDNHLGFYQLANFGNFQSKETVADFVNSKEFADYPKSDINIDSLKFALGKRPLEQIEGIYHYDSFYTIGIFKIDDTSLIGVVLDSDIPTWTKGQIAVRLYEYDTNLYRAIYGHPLFKTFYLYPNEKFVNQSLINSHFYQSISEKIYSKNTQQTDFVNLPKDGELFKFEKLDENTQYLLIRTFQRNTKTSKESLEFFNSIKNVVTGDALIVDLRNNEGGAKKEMKKYLDLFKKFSKKGHIYVLVNNGTISQAEILTLSMKKLKNVTLVGQTTNGKLAYGSNYGKAIKLASGKFEVYPTDMKASGKLFPYENYGIVPEIVLDNATDWLVQIQKLIKK